MCKHTERTVYCFLIEPSQFPVTGSVEPAEELSPFQHLPADPIY